MSSLIRRLWQCFRAPADLAAWRESLGISLAATAVIAAIAFPAGLVHWQPRLDGWPLRLLTVMVIPAFSEELVFRGLLIPARGESRYPVRWFRAGIAAFVLWHVVEAITFLPHATMFLRPLFLVCVAVLGIACALMRYRTGSLWPAVLLHGVVVFIWQVLLGGPAIKDLI